MKRGGKITLLECGISLQVIPVLNVVKPCPKVQSSASSAVKKSKECNRDEKQ